MLAAQTHISTLLAVRRRIAERVGRQARTVQHRPLFVLPTRPICERTPPHYARCSPPNAAAISFKTHAVSRATMRRMKTRLIGYLYLAAAMTGVGSTVIASRIAADGLPPFAATALRFLIATPLLFALMRAQRMRWPRISARDALLLVVQAAAGGVGYTVLLLCGTKLSSPVDAGVMLGTLPAMSTLIAAVVLRERQTPRDWIAAALATAGVLLVTFAPGHAMPSIRTLAGDALVLAAVGCEAVFILLNRRLGAPLAPLALSTAMSGLGFVLALVPAAFEWRALAAGWTVGAVAAIAYYALVPTVLGYLCWYAGSARTSGTEAALFTAVAPVSAVLFAVALFGETLGGTRLPGIALVVAGMLIGATRRRDTRDHSRNAPRRTLVESARSAQSSVD
jgi:drug/metabolite transporter (DMT)-like permease